jgi:hypothetical protein
MVQVEEEVREELEEMAEEVEGKAVQEDSMDLMVQEEGKEDKGEMAVRLYLLETKHLFPQKHPRVRDPEVREVREVLLLRKVLLQVDPEEMEEMVASEVDCQGLPDREELALEINQRAQVVLEARVQEVQTEVVLAMVPDPLHQPKRNARGRLI